MPRLGALLCSATTLLWSGCVASVSAPGGPAPCGPSEDCAAGELCTDGLCVASSSTACAVDGGCTTSGPVDDPVAPESDGGPLGCGSTSECPIDTFCDASGATSACAPLPAGLCRADEHCAAATPFCSAEPGRVDRCVACLDDNECASGTCFDTGACAPPPPSSLDCPANSSPLPGTNTCKCNGGFQAAASGACVPLAADAPETLQCVQHAHATPGAAGQCECDAGFEPSTTAAACVPADAAAPPTTPPGGNGGSVDDDGGGCGPNSFALFFVCVCFPGTVVDPSGAPGCAADDGNDDLPEEPAPAPPEPPPPPDEPAPAVLADCAAHSSPDPSDDAFCICDEGFVANEAEDGCIEDGCASLGYYGDGEYCDDFCPLPDPDC